MNKNSKLLFINDRIKLHEISITIKFKNFIYSNSGNCLYFLFTGTYSKFIILTVTQNLIISFSKIKINFFFKNKFSSISSKLRYLFYGN